MGTASKGDDRPAFPVFSEMGLTKREFFASHALQGLLAVPAEYNKRPQDLVKAAVKYANLMVEELEK